jgi:uncharacterized membrane protein
MNELPSRSAFTPLDRRKFRDPDVTADGQPRAAVALSRLETLWINTGTLCNITCANCYIESSPVNDRLAYITAAEAAELYDEIARLELGTRQIAFTGGEPFMNPWMLAMAEDALQRGFEVLILTNAMQPMQRNSIRAGLQRLLRAAGHDVRLIDGVAGRNTRSMIAAFERETGQRFGDDRGALMRALHEVALERNAAAGLSVCNQSGAAIAAAVGVTRGDEPESRGWWRIEDGACGRVLGGWLEAGDAFIYAKSLADETVPQSLLDGDEAFCIAPVRFRTEGRGGCEARGYETAEFRTLPGIEDGSAVLTLTTADFTASPRPAETGAGSQP